VPFDAFFPFLKYLRQPTEQQFFRLSPLHFSLNLDSQYNYLFWQIVTYLFTLFHILFIYRQQVKLLCYLHRLMEVLVFVTKVSRLHIYLFEI
jgi:hypothetical protein